MSPPRRLDSPANPTVKQLAGLRARKGRRAQGRMLIEGRRELARALASGVVVETLLVEDGELGADEQAWVRQALEAGAERIDVSPRVRAKLAYRDPPESPLLAVAPLPGVGLDRLEARGAGPILVVDGAEKPGNLGALLRSADGAGAAAVLVTGPGADLGNPNLIRASLGAIFSLPVGVGAPAEAAAWVRARGRRVVATSPDAARPYWQADLSGGVALVLGSEKDGLGEDWFQLADEQVSIPMRGLVDSLNLAQAGTLLLYEASKHLG